MAAAQIIQGLAPLVVAVILFLFVLLPRLRDVNSLGNRVLGRVRPLFSCSWTLLLSCICPCYVFGRNVQKMDGESKGCMTCAFCLLGQWAMSGMYRDRVYREAGGVNPGHCVNLATHWTCGPCALAQEAEVVDALVAQRGPEFAMQQCRDQEALPEPASGPGEGSSAVNPMATATTGPMTKQDMAEP